jgi:hypothetical protein
MAWKTFSKIEQRFDLVRALQRKDRSASELCRYFHIGRTTASK